MFADFQEFFVLFFSAAYYVGLAIMLVAALVVAIVNCFRWLI